MKNWSLFMLVIFYVTPLISALTCYSGDNIGYLTSSKVWPINGQTTVCPSNVTYCYLLQAVNPQDSNAWLQGYNGDCDVPKPHPTVPSYIMRSCTKPGCYGMANLTDYVTTMCCCDTDMCNGVALIPNSGSSSSTQTTSTQTTSTQTTSTQTTSAAPTEVSLPAQCYDPPGTDCSFYSDCLEQVAPCGIAPDAYAIPYGQKYCQLYSDNYHLFSVEGKEWIDAVRKCLQQKLVPYLTSKPPTCKSIKQIAFASHTGCYTNPKQGLSVCFILQDLKVIIQTINESLLSDTSSTVSQMLQSFVTCGAKYIKIGYVKVISTGKDISNEIKTTIGNFLNWVGDKLDRIQVFRKSRQTQKRQASDSTEEYYLIIVGTSDEPASDIMDLIVTEQNNGTLQFPASGVVTPCDGACESSNSVEYSLSRIILLVVFLFWAILTL